MTRPARTLLALLALLPLACIDPADRRPGLWLTGEIAEEAGGDWSFTDAHREIAIETRTPWLIPHSVTIVCAANEGRFFVGARNPEGKRWVANVDRDPDVRLQIEGRIYEQRLVPLEDDQDQATARAAYAAKYGWPESPADQPPIRYFEVVDRR